MKVVAFSSGTLASLFPLEAFAPLGGLDERQIIGSIGERYNFGTSPTISSHVELERDGLVFEFGFFATQLGEVTIQRMSIHNDGVVVRANKTDHAEAFFNDLTDWLVEDYGCRQIIKKPLYLSEIVVDLEKPAARLFSKCEKIVNAILSNVHENREARGAALNGISIEFATTSVPIPKFTIERRAGTSAEDERYFCSAPLTTQRHLQVLEEIERLL